MAATRKARKKKKAKQKRDVSLSFDEESPEGISEGDMDDPLETSLAFLPRSDEEKSIVDFIKE